jgi:hypothetical protein
MRLIFGRLPQMLVMASVVTTALFVPVLTVLGVLAIGLFGVSLRAFVTFGAALSAAEGLAAWWAILFVPALAYSACMMPWGGKNT